jgi:hypothetical protein
MQARAVRTFTIAAWRLPVLAKWLTVLNGLGMLIMGGFMVVTPSGGVGRNHFGGWAINHDPSRDHPVADRLLWAREDPAGGIHWALRLAGSWWKVGSALTMAGLPAHAYSAARRG